MFALMYRSQVVSLSAAGILTYPARPITVSMVSQVKCIDLTLLCQVQISVKTVPAATPAMYEDDLGAPFPPDLIG